MTENNTQLAARYLATTEELLQLIEKFDNESFNRKPSAETWSAGQIAEHLLIFDIRLKDILKTAVHPTERDVTEKNSAVSARVSNRANKIDAPAFLIPSTDRQSPSDLIEKIRIIRIETGKIIEGIDLSLHSKEFPHRLFGELTVHEWVNLIDIHTRRHLAQLRELLN